MSQSDKPYRVFVVDDHPAVGEGLALLLTQRGVIICGEAGDGRQAAERIGPSRPDVVVVDLTLQNGNGLALIERLRQQGRHVLVYSMHEDAVHVMRAFSAGALGYVTKREGAETLVQAIREVSAGHRYLSERARNSLLDGGENALEVGRVPLSDRESMVMQWLGDGDSIDEIGQRLHISARTVETYCKRIIEKLGLEGMKELRRLAIKHARQ